jgi:hypothetical protein
VRGAAILAGLGCGALRSPTSVADRLGEVAHEGAKDNVARESACGHVVRHEPDPHAHARLEGIFARRAALYDAVRPLFA